MGREIGKGLGKDIERLAVVVGRLEGGRRGEKVAKLEEGGEEELLTRLARLTVRIERCVA